MDSNGTVWISAVKYKPDHDIGTGTAAIADIENAMAAVDL